MTKYLKNIFILFFFTKFLIAQNEKRYYLISVGSFKNYSTSNSYVNPYYPLSLIVSTEKNKHWLGVEANYYAIKTISPFFSGGIEYRYNFYKNKRNLFFIPIISKVCYFSWYDTFSSYNQVWQDDMADFYPVKTKSFFISTGAGYKFKLFEWMRFYISFTSGYCFTRNIGWMVQAKSNSIIFNLQYGIEFKLTKTKKSGDECNNKFK